MFEVKRPDDSGLDFLGYVEACQVFRLLSAYCHSKATEIAHRDKGNVGMALEAKAIGEQVLAQLPEWARW